MTKKYLEKEIADLEAHPNNLMIEGDIFRATGADWAYISNVESGNQNPTLDTLSKIAKALELGVDDLIQNSL